MSASRTSWLCLFVLLCGFGSVSELPAQDFRVYTSVSSLANPAAPRVISRSLTLFHAGIVYDHMEECGELLIFEPVHDRFTLVREHTAATVSFDELNRLLSMATREASRYVAELAAQDEVDAQLACRQLQFQLRPRFERQLSGTSDRLTLHSDILTYDVRVARTGAPQRVEQYLAYADWAARLNAVLHSKAMFPNPRLALNEELRKEQLLPISVTLRSQHVNNPNLRADHEFRWQLQPIDKDLIHQWEQLRRSGKMQWVSFHEYQQRLLTTTVKAVR